LPPDHLAELAADTLQCVGATRERYDEAQSAHRAIGRALPSPTHRLALRLCPRRLRRTGSLVSFVRVSSRVVLSHLVLESRELMRKLSPASRSRCVSKCLGRGLGRCLLTYWGLSSLMPAAASCALSFSISSSFAWSCCAIAGLGISAAFLRAILMTMSVFCCVSPYARYAPLRPHCDVLRRKT
jgi:hypothetical protein